MEEFLKAKEGPEADLWAMLVEEVLQAHWHPSRAHQPDDRAE